MEHSSQHMTDIPDSHLDSGSTWAAFVICLDMYHSGFKKKQYSVGGELPDFHGYE